MKVKPTVKFSEELFTEICNRIANGESLTRICSSDDMPKRKTFNLWRQISPELQAEYDRACLDREEYYFEQIIDLADQVRLFELQKHKSTGEIETTIVDSIERTRVQIDARKWALARMNRKKYGEKMGIDGGEDGSPLVVKIIRHGDDE